MKWIGLLLLAISFHSELYAQGDVATQSQLSPNPEHASEDPTAQRKSVEVVSQLHSLFEDSTTTTGTANSSDQKVKPEEAPIQLNMVIVQAGTDESYEDDTQQLTRDIQELAQELRLLQAKEVADEEAKDKKPPSELNSRRALAAQASGKNRQVQDLVNKKHGLTLLSVPKLIAYAGAVAETHIGQSTSIQYMEQIESGVFKLKMAPPRLLGINISMMPSIPYETKGARGVTNTNVNLSPIVLALAAMDGREKIEGIDLPVGKPIFTLRTIETSLNLIQGEPGIIELPVGKGKHVFMIIFAQVRD